MTDSAKANLLFITTDLPWPADSGGKIKTFRLVEYLSRHYNVRLLCARGGELKAEMLALRSNCAIQSVQAFENHSGRSALNWIKSLMRFPTLSAQRVYSRELESMIRASINATDLVLVDHLEMLEMVPERQLSKVMYHSHNAEFKLWDDYARLEKNPLKKLAIGLEADRMKSFERRMVKATKFTFAAPNDSALMSVSLNVSAEKFRLTYHLGNDTLLNQPRIDLSANAQRIFYAGTLSWIPNQDGLMWFLHHCWPAVLAKVPKAELVVCGRGADLHFENTLKHTPNLHYKGFVADLEIEMNACRAAIVPLRFGSGMKIKTFDALYRGLPVVTTETGAEGIDLLPLIVSDSAESFAARLVHVLNHPDESQSETDVLRELVKERYTYDRIFDQMRLAINAKN